MAEENQQAPAQPVQKQEEENLEEETPQEAPAALPTATAQETELPKGLLGQVKRIASPIPRKVDQLKAFAIECQRVLRVTKKPSREEFQTIVKISAIGIAVIGLLGFIVHATKELLF